MPVPASFLQVERRPLGLDCAYFPPGFDCGNAADVALWVRRHGGETVVTATELDIADAARPPQYRPVAPGTYVVHLGEGAFDILSASDFAARYRKST